MSRPRPLDPQRAFQVLLDLYDTSVEIMRQNLRRQHPDASEADIEVKLRRWLMKADQYPSRERAAHG